MMGMETRYIAVLLFAAFFISAVSAADPAPPPTNPNAKAMLAAGVSDMQCRVAYDTDLMNAIVTTFPSLSAKLSFRIPILQSDMQMLSQYADDGNSRSFRNYLQQNFSQHLKLDNSMIKQSLDSIKEDRSLDKNETKTKMRSLKATNDALMSVLNNCSNVNKHVTLMLGYYSNSLTNYEKIANNMSSKGVDASGMLALVSSARSQILTPLQTATTGVTDGQALKLALDTYCLYDGCTNGTNFHMAAKFETARMYGLLSVIAQENMSDAMRNVLRDAENLLDTANSRITSWGAVDVQPADIQSVWGQITSAAKGLHEVFVTVKGSQQPGDTPGTE